MAKKDEAKKTAAATDADEAPYGWDLVGSDGRRIYRNIPLAFANDEKGRIQNQTREKLSVEVATPPAWVEATSNEKLETVDGGTVSEAEVAEESEQVATP